MYVHDFIKDFISLCVMLPVRVNSHIFDDVYKLKIFLKTLSLDFCSKKHFVCTRPCHKNKTIKCWHDRLNL